jgi:hypothetical protein
MILPPPTSQFLCNRLISPCRVFKSVLNPLTDYLMYTRALIRWSLRLCWARPGYLIMASLTTFNQRRPVLIILTL